MKKIIAALLITLVLLTSCQQDKKINRYGDSEYDCIVVIGIDGAGTFFGANTPNFDRIFVENGAYTHSARCETPSISAQNWGTYLHGIVPEKHNSTNISIGTQRFPHREYPSIFLLTRKAYPQCEMASFCSWCPINYGLIEKKADVYKDTDLQFLNSLHTDRETTDLVLEYLDTTVPQLMFIHYNETDEEGHSHGYGSDLHKSCISQIDSYIGEVYDKCKSVADNVLFIVVTDHGGTPDGYHGGDTDAEMTITCAFSGSTINPSADLTGFKPRDLAAILLNALKIEIPANMDGKIPDDLFVKAI